MARTRWKGHLVEVSERNFARAVLAVEERSQGETVNGFIDWALGQALAVHETQMRHQGQVSARQLPFVRPAPEAVGLKAAGRPSSRRHQEGRSAEAGSKAAKPGPERPAATRSAASMARTREDPPFDAAEHSGTPLLEEPPEDRWGPPVGDLLPPVRKHTSRP